MDGVSVRSLTGFEVVMAVRDLVHAWCLSEVLDRFEMVMAVRDWVLARC